MKYCVLLCLLGITSCRKIDRSILGDTKEMHYETLIKDFLFVKENSFNENQLNAFNEVKRGLVFSKLKEVDYGNGDKMIMVEMPNIAVDDYLKFENEIKIANNSQDSELKRSSSKVVTAVFYSHNNKVFDGQIVELRSKIHSEDFLRNNFHRIVKNEKIDFSGSISVNTLFKKHLNEFSFHKSRITSASRLIVKNKTSGMSTTSKKTNTESICYDWYKETTYYFTDGSTSSSSVYLGRTCSIVIEPGENQVPQQGETNAGNANVIADTLCSMSRRLSTDTVFIKKMDSLQNSAASDNFEAGYQMKSNGSGGYSYEYKRGNIGEKSMNFTLAHGEKYAGLVHTHYQGCLEGVGLADVKSIYDAYLNDHIESLENFIYGVIMPDRKMIILRITDVTSFIVFSALNLNGTSFQSWASIAGMYMSMGTGKYEQNLKELVYALSGSGITVYESNTTTFWNGYKEVSVDSPNLWLKRTLCVQ